MTSSGLEKHEEPPKKTSDFSIDHILNRAGNSNEKSEENFRFPDCDTETIPFTWLQCSRYCPPKIPRKREGSQKRQLGRHPRIPFTSHQLAILEDRFKQSPYLSSEEVTRLSSILQLADIRVKIWFQNRRARERREKNQPECSKSSPTSPNKIIKSESNENIMETKSQEEISNIYQPWFT